MPGLARRPGAVVAVVVAACFVAAAGAGCAPSGYDLATGASSPSPGSSGAPGHTHEAQPSARHVRLLMEQLLGHHAILMVRLMRGPIDGEESFVEAASGALQRNTNELEGAVASIYDDEVGARFARLWTDHVNELVAYSRAVATGDGDARDQAQAALGRYAGEYGQFVEGITAGETSAGAVTAGVAAHIHHMVMATDAYQAGDYEAAYAGERTAYAGMFGMGRALSGAALRQSTGELAVGFASQATDLRSALGRLLGEHVELAFDATRAVVTASPSSDAAAGALEANTAEIIAAMQGSLHRRTTARFSRIWAAHVDAIVRFAVAVADRDDEAQARARAALDTFPEQFGAVLPTVARGSVAAGEVVAALHEHDQQLLQQVTAFAAGDYPTSHHLAYEGYDHMFAIADVFAAALEGRAADASPKGGASTGGGGTAGR